MRVAPRYLQKIDWHESGLGHFYAFFLVCTARPGVPRLRHLVQAEMCERQMRDLSLLTPIFGIVDEPPLLLVCLPCPLHSRLQGVSRSVVPGSHGRGRGVTHPWERATLSQP